MRINQFSIYTHRFLMWQDTTRAVRRHRFVISHPSSCSLGLLSLKSFKSSAQQSVWRRHLTTSSQTIYRPSLYSVCITFPYTLTMLLLLLLAFLVPKIFWKKHMFGPDVFLIFVVIILFYFIFCLCFIFYLLSWSCVFQCSSLKQHTWKCH